MSAPPARQAFRIPARNASCSDAGGSIFIPRLRDRILNLLSLLLLLLPAPASAQAINFGPEIIISVRDQQLAILENGAASAQFHISTSRFGVGDEPNSYKTPLGVLWVFDKIGDNLPVGAVIKDRSPTGEIVRANAPGRDPIVTRVIWLKGLFGTTGHAFERCIYIHGTPMESSLGHPSSYGCIRMRSDDILIVYNKVQIGTHVLISEQPLKKLIRQESPNTLDIPSS
ncbi:MAG: L,D-transpeptidase [Chthoniobacteraceae bacterium]|jgi:hypothetical protein